MAPHHLLRRFFRRPARSDADTLVEPLILLVMLMLVVAGSVSLLTMANRGFSTSRATSDTDNAIDADIDRIVQISERLTCCSGTCLIGPPDTSAVGPERSCATADPSDDNYFFPQQDDPATPELNETRAVDALCRSDNNVTFMTPLKQAIDGLPNPRVGDSSVDAALRTSTILPEHVLRLTYTMNGQVVHIAHVVPPMAAWCP